MNNHCTHLHAYFGLDAAYCPDCQQTFDSGSRTYGQILKRGSRRESPEDTKLCGSDDTESSFKGFEFGAVGNNAHEHQFTLVWSADCTLVSRCSCGEKRGCDVQELQELLRNCIVVRAEYLLEKDKSSSKSRQQEFARAIADKDKQIGWLESQIRSRSHSEQSSPYPSTIALDEIRRDGGTQPRAAIDLKHVMLLEEQMEDGLELEPVTVFYDSESYWLADGFHRWQAHRNQEREVLDCIVYSGSRREAVLYSVGANADNKPALPRSRQDKQRAVLTLLTDSEWKEWSDREIAKRCLVHHNTVSKIRASLTGDLSSNTSIQSLTGDLSSEKRRYRTKHGTVAKMNTANIGLKAFALPENLLDNTVTERGDHPGQSGKIRQLPIPDSATVDLDTGERDLKHIVAGHLKFNKGGLVEINAPENNKIDGRRGRIASLCEHTVDVWLRDVNTMIMQKHTIKYQQVIPLPLEQEPQLKQVCDRLSKLRSCSLDPFEVEIVNLLERTIVLTPTEMKYLQILEDCHENEL